MDDPTKQTGMIMQEYWNFQFNRNLLGNDKG